MGKQDQRLLQTDLQNLYHWAVSNNMEFNDDKFAMITFGHQNKRNFKSPEGKVITRKTSYKDLGIPMSANCEFTEHIHIAVKETQKIASWALRTFRSRDKNVMRTLLKSIVIPKIEYGAIIWSPTNLHLIVSIENIQRRFTSRISDFQTYDPQLDISFCTTNYWERLKHLKLYSLERRRERFIILYIYRFIIGLIKIEFFEVYEERGLKLRRKFKQSAPEFARKLRKSSFFYRGPQLYNLLPSNLRQFEEIDSPSRNNVLSFKNRLDNYLKDIPDQPTTVGLQRAAESNSLIHQIPMRERLRRDEY